MEIKNTKFTCFKFVSNTTVSHWETTQINGSLVECCEMWSYHVDGCEGYILPGCDVMKSGRCLLTFQRHLPTLMTDTTDFTETSAYIYRTIWCHSWTLLLRLCTDADKCLALLTSRCILFDGENISFHASLVKYIYVYIYINIYIYI